MTPTKLSTSDIALDLAVLHDLLRAEGTAATAPLTALRVGKGQSNLTYLVSDAAGSRWIARRPPRGHLLNSAHDVLRESLILAALHGTNVPVPAVLGEFTNSNLADAPVVVMQHVDGLVLDGYGVAEASTQGLRRALGPSLARTMATIHAVDLDAVGLSDLASRAPYAARQMKRWSRQWEASRTRDLPALDRLTELLRRTTPTQREVTLVHGDLHLQNVIADPATGEIRAVLDWELSTLGDPLADMGTLLAYWLEADDPPTGLFAASALPGFVTRRQLADDYLAASGRDGADLEYWHVLGLWKIAIIVEGIRRRTIEDPRNSADGTALAAELVDAVIERAWRTVAAAGLDRS